MSVARPASLPQPIQKLLRRCLNKDPKRRLRDIGDVRIELEDLLEEWGRPTGPEAAAVGAPAAGAVLPDAAGGPMELPRP